MATTLGTSPISLTLLNLNEVFVTSLLSHLGYLSARTQKIEKVYFNN